MIEKLIAGLALISTIGGTAFFLDDRHASADELEKFKKQSLMTHTENRKSKLSKSKGQKAHRLKYPEKFKARFMLNN